MHKKWRNEKMKNTYCRTTLEHSGRKNDTRGRLDSKVSILCDYILRPKSSRLNFSFPAEMVQLDSIFPAESGRIGPKILDFFRLAIIQTAEVCVLLVVL